MHKQLLPHFFSTSGFNEYVIEILIASCSLRPPSLQLKPINVNGHLQLTRMVGKRKTMKLNFFKGKKENKRSKDMKNLIKAMGANNTKNTINKASKACGGVKKNCGRI